MITTSASPDNEPNKMQSLGGKARAKSLTPEQRSESARNAAIAKWDKSPNAKKIPKATHMGELVIGGMVIPCANLDNGERVISDRSLAETLGIRGGGAYWKRKKKGESGAMLPEYISAKYLQGFITEPIRARILDSITYDALNGTRSNAIKATVLADICDIWIKAKQSGAIEKEQHPIADNAYTLLMGFASVGINALIDEATGYQYDRPRKDLEEQLKEFLSEHYRKWVRTFPADYFKHLCRLRGVEMRPDMKLPQYFGKLTNNLIYRRLAPGLLKKLKERKSERGNASDKLHSWLSEDVGFRGVLVHLGIVVGIMKIHTNYEAFEKQLDTIAPIYADSPGLFDDPKDWEVPA
jgi:P63C domain-containing protein